MFEFCNCAPSVSFDERMTIRQRHQEHWHCSTTFKIYVAATSRNESNFKFNSQTIKFPCRFFVHSIAIMLVLTVETVATMMKLILKPSMKPSIVSGPIWFHVLLPYEQKPKVLEETKSITVWLSRRPKPKHRRGGCLHHSHDWESWLSSIPRSWGVDVYMMFKFAAPCDFRLRHWLRHWLPIPMR